MAPNDGLEPSEPTAIELEVASHEPLEFAHHVMTMTGNLAAGINVQQVQTGLRVFEQDFGLPKLCVLIATGGSDRDRAQ